MNKSYYSPCSKCNNVECVFKGTSDTHELCEDFMGWIPVSERLPEENEYIGDVCKYYLIQDEYGDMHVAHLSNVGWIPMDSLKAIGNEVIAWCELPQPYDPQESEAQNADSD